MIQFTVGSVYNKRTQADGKPHVERIVGTRILKQAQECWPAGRRDSGNNHESIISLIFPFLYYVKLYPNL